jgi:hypothetical protein
MGSPEENWSSENEKVIVTATEGYLCHIEVKAKLPIDPDGLFALLIDPDNARFFRSIEVKLHLRLFP